MSERRPLWLSNDNSCTSPSCCEITDYGVFTPPVPMWKSHIAADQYGAGSGGVKENHIRQCQYLKHASLKAHAACTINDKRWFHIEWGSFREVFGSEKKASRVSNSEGAGLQPTRPWLSHSSAALHTRSQTLQHSDGWYFVCSEKKKTPKVLSPQDVLPSSRGSLDMKSLKVRLRILDWIS